ncbi:O-fucosyltransferase 16, partial [Cucurbita argyrosperma subsp. sororia]
MAFQRRRNHYYHRFRFLIPFILAISGSLLLFFAVLSFLAPSPNDSDHSRRIPPVQFDAASVEEIGVSHFRVPRNGARSARDLWTSRNAKFYSGCTIASNKFQKASAITHPNRYLLIATSGGLNQQRTGITDAVVAARILNATLVVPKLDQKSFWRDSSNFSEIFDVDWFVSFLSRDVKIIHQLPKRGGKTWNTHSMRVPRKCSERCYQTRVLPVLLKRHAIQLSKFDYRLANRLETDLQKLRCRVNYHALKFTDPIQKMGENLVQRMRARSNHYIALHLRFEPDMLAFSGCYYGGGEKERGELGAIRRRWKTLHQASNPDKERRHGKCPLTPEEVGLMLRALGYGQDVHIYVASGEVYGGEETLAPLKALFPNFHSKETIASKEELEKFSSYSSRMAALDFIVCDESDVFVTNNNGNMARILAGRRRYFGHKPTIRPNAKKLYRLFLNRANMTWRAFSSRVRTYQRGFMGEPNEVRPGRGEFHENPSPCICADTKPRPNSDSGTRTYGKGDIITPRRDEPATIDDQNNDYEPERGDSDEEEEPADFQDKGPFNVTSLDYDANNSEEPELEEMLSD